jgi:hypothetical protein
LKAALVLIIILTGLISCSTDSKKSVIAEVNGTKLYLEDVIQSVPLLDDEADTLSLLNQKAESWTRDQLLLAEAKKSSNKDEIKAMVAQYEESLLITQFENTYVEQNLNTTISEQELTRYAQDNKLEVDKEQEMIKVKFGKVKKNQPELERLDSLWQAKKWEEISSYCGTFAEICLLESQWMPLTELQQYFSNKIFNKDVLQKKGYSQKSGSKYEYFLTVLGHKKETATVSSMDKKKIEKLILHDRSLQLLKRYKENLYQESLDNQKIKFYLN